MAPAARSAPRWPPCRPACAPPSCCGTQILAFQIAGGQWVVIQVPVPLGWDSAELAKFAGGVQVLAAAQQGRG
jgi:hypothetical protein